MAELLRHEKWHRMMPISMHDEATDQEHADPAALAAR
jgi:hypothetical protein